MSSDYSPRPLSHVTLGVSASENDDANDLGFTKREVNRCVREIATAVMTQGGSVVFGHDWRSEGVMGELLQLAISHQHSPRRANGQGPPMTNFVPWPSKTTVSSRDRKRYHDILQIIEMDRPKHHQRTEGLSEAKDKDTDLVNRVFALTEMRKTMTSRDDQTTRIRTDT